MLDPPGLWTAIGLSSLGIIKLNPVAEDDLTILALEELGNGEIFGLKKCKNLEFKKIRRHIFRLHF